MKKKLTAKSKEETLLLRKLHSFETKFAEIITNFAGSMSFVYFHAIWFVFWILAGQGHFSPLIPKFDPFPYGLLTMIVSLEAIFLATFIMITQNRMALEDDLEELEEEREQLEEEKEQEELEEEVEDIQQDLDDIKAAILTISQKVASVEKLRPGGTNDNGSSSTPIETT